ncbi:hypothetical protein GCM10020369_58630 [Cryptosporangium minutisporangium]|uniref:Uncharacterized protein n=1 Tax=Cryptosporangium minutisporangium TaxID=113569 RepID=A0ABP6T7A2_9ACTN
MLGERVGGGLAVGVGGAGEARGVGGAGDGGVGDVHGVPAQRGLDHEHQQQKQQWCGEREFGGDRTPIRTAKQGTGLAAPSWRRV